MRPARWNLTARSGVVVAAVVMGLGAAPAQSAAAVGGGWRWTSDVVLVHDESGSPEVGRAVGAWDRLSRLRIEPTDTPCTIGEACVEVGVRALIPTLGGWAEWAHDGDRLIGCSVTINGTPAYPLSEAQRDDVALHELGHCLGLQHSSQRPSAMDDLVEPLTEPTEVDGEALRALYGA